MYPFAELSRGPLHMYQYMFTVFQTRRPTRGCSDMEASIPGEPLKLAPPIGSKPSLMGTLMVETNFSDYPLVPRNTPSSETPENPKCDDREIKNTTRWPLLTIEIRDEKTSGIVCSIYCVVSCRVLSLKA